MDMKISPVRTGSAQEAHFPNETVSVIDSGNAKMTKPAWLG